MYCAEDPPGFATHQLHRVGILLLRHQARAGGNCITQFKETKFSSRVEDDIFRQSREVNHDQRTGAHKLHAEITIADRINAVARHAVKAQLARNGFTIDR